MTTLFFKDLVNINNFITNTNQVCDYPLAVMDARTFKPENQIPYELHINFIADTFHNLNGAISYSPDQKWWYYSRQSTREVLVFHQFTKVN